VQANVGTLTLAELNGRAAPFRQTVKNLELALQNYPLALQSANAYRTHVAEQRDFLKWVAAFASAGLFFVLNGLRGTSSLRLDTQVGSWVAIITFLLSTTAAGMYWWRVDLAIGRYFESLQHRVATEIVSLREIILAVGALDRAIAEENLIAANAAYTVAAARSEEADRRGELERPRQYDNEPISLFWKGLCLGGYATGTLTLVIDQLIRAVP
jgi:hypothetical protein